MQYIFKRAIHNVGRIYLVLTIYQSTVEPHSYIQVHLLAILTARSCHDNLMNIVSWQVAMALESRQLNEHARQDCYTQAKLVDLCGGFSLLAYANDGDHTRGTGRPGSRARPYRGLIQSIEAYHPIATLRFPRISVISS